MRRLRPANRTMWGVLSHDHYHGCPQRQSLALALVSLGQARNAQHDRTRPVSQISWRTTVAHHQTDDMRFLCMSVPPTVRS